MYSSIDWRWKKWICLFIKKFAALLHNKGHTKILSNILFNFHIFLSYLEENLFSMNIFVLTDVLDPYGPISTPQTSNLSIVPISWSHVIVRGRFISHFKLRPDPIATTVIDSYLHHHRLSRAHLWWRSRLVSWLQVAVIGWARNQAQPEIFESQDTHSNSALFHHCMLNNSTTTALIHSILVCRHSPGPFPSMAVLLESDIAA